MTIVCLAQDGTEEFSYEADPEGISPWIEVDLVAYYFESYQDDEMIYRRPA